MRDVCRSMGLQEVRTYSLVNPAAIRKWAGAPAPGEGESAAAMLPGAVFIGNPDTAEMSALRASLGPGLVDALTVNRRKHTEPVPVLFELGRVYGKGEPAAECAYRISRDDASYYETRTIGVILGEDSIIPAALGASFGNLSPIFAAKSLVARLLAELGFDAAFEEPAEGAPYWCEPGRALAVTAASASGGGARRAGAVGLLRIELDPMESARGSIAYAELNIDTLRSLPSEKAGIKSPSQFPAILRDIALVAPLQVPAGALSGAIRAAGGADLADVAVFDQYIGKQVPPREIGGKLTPCKNLAFNLRFQRSDRTLTNEEVDRAIFDILAGAFSAHAAVLRDYEHVKSDSIFNDAALWGRLLNLYGA